jgi:Pyruvate/2-oxoacid:ferredoxin oxidoreductase delta subunit
VCAFLSSYFTLPLTCTLFPLRIGWRALPFPQMQNGTSNKQHQCVGCNLCLSNDPGIPHCYFLDTGFTLANTRGRTWMQPCRLAYHATCIAVGAPFVTRQKDHAGLSFPNIASWGTFVCKACTICAVVCYELTDTNDWQLLALCASLIWLTIGRLAPMVPIRPSSVSFATLSNATACFLYSDLCLCVALPVGQIFPSCSVKRHMNFTGPPLKAIPVLI